MNQEIDNMQCTATIDDGTKTITLQGLTTTNLVINFTDDIDFTEFVSTLTSLIDNSKKIELATYDTGTDEKLKLIMETISAIIDKYNESISNNGIPTQENINLEDDLPF